jgi:hypothetical protein
MKILTGNRLADGVVIYLGVGGTWVRELAHAQRLAPETAATALEAAQAQSRFLVGPYLVDVGGDKIEGDELEGGEIEPRERLRETIRAAGPSVGHSLDWGQA